MNTCCPCKQCRAARAARALPSAPSVLAIFKAVATTALTPMFVTVRFSGKVLAVLTFLLTSLYISAKAKHQYKDNKMIDWTKPIEIVDGTAVKVHDDQTGSSPTEIIVTIDGWPRWYNRVTGKHTYCSMPDVRNVSSNDWAVICTEKAWSSAQSDYPTALDLANHQVLTNPNNVFLVVQIKLQVEMVKAVEIVKAQIVHTPFD